MVTRMRHTRSHTANRRSHHALKSKNLSVDKETGSVHLGHHIDMKTGRYKGRQVLNLVKKAEKKQSKTASKTK